MDANKNKTVKAGKSQRRWHIIFGTSFLGILVASMLLCCVSCTGGLDGDDGTVADSNVGSVTSDGTDRETGKSSEKVTDRVTEAPTEAGTEGRTEQGSGSATMPGLVPETTPGTTPGTDAADSGEAASSAVTTEPGTGMRGRSGHMGGK